MRTFFRFWGLAFGLCLISACLPGGAKSTGAPAGIATDGKPAPGGDSFDATVTPGGVVSAPVDVEGYEPGAGKNATPSSPTANDAPSDAAEAEAPKEYASAPGVPEAPPPMGGVLSDGFASCDKTHYVRLFWMQDFRWFLELDKKTPREQMIAQIEPAMAARIPAIVERVTRREDACVDEAVAVDTVFPPLVRYGTAVVFKHESPENGKADQAFHNADEVSAFLAKSEVVDYFLPPPLKIPGK